MSIARKIITGDAGGPIGPQDPDFANVSLLLNGDGNNGADNNTFTDSSSNNFPISVTGTGSVSQGSFSPYATSEPLDMTTDGGSGYFQSGTYLSIPSISTMNVGSKMSAEAWIYVDQLPSANIGSGGQGIIFSRWTASGSNRSWIIFLGADGQLGFWFSSNGGTSYSTCDSAAGVIKTGQWYHIAATWDGVNQRLFVDGTLKQTTANTVGPKRAVSATFAVNACNTNTTSTSKMYVSDVRFFNNAQNPYITNFTPPSRPVSAGTSAVTLNFQDAGIYDLSGTSDIATEGAKISTSVKKYGTGSIDFTGSSSDRLDVKENGNALTFGTGDFTIETWVYFNDTALAFLFDWRDGSGNYGKMPAVYSQNNTIRYYDGNNTVITSNPISNRLQRWMHLAVVRSGGQIKLYIDGTQEGITYPDLGSYIGTQTGLLHVGGRTEGYSLNGYMDDFRITKGVARYTANFTPPTEALPTF